MKRVLLALLLCAGCFHTQHVEKKEAPDEPTTSSEKQPAQSEGGASQRPALARRPQRPGRPGLAAGPDALFVPGGVNKVQHALAEKGYLDLAKADDGRIDASTSAALREFQSHEGIARTGNPDHETVRRLGLNPDELFRKSEDSKAQ